MIKKTLEAFSHSQSRPDGYVFITVDSSPSRSRPNCSSRVPGAVFHLPATIDWRKGL